MRWQTKRAPFPHHLPHQQHQREIFSATPAGPPVKTYQASLFCTHERAKFPPILLAQDWFILALSETVVGGRQRCLSLLAPTLDSGGFGVNTDPLMSTACMPCICFGDVSSLDRHVVNPLHRVVILKVYLLFLRLIETVLIRCRCHWFTRYCCVLHRNS